MGKVAGQQLANLALSYIGHLIYVSGADHQPILNLNPIAVDCSSFVRLIVAKVAGRDIMGNGTTETYWGNQSFLGGTVPGDQPIWPGDLIERYGDGTFPPPGHIAFCVSYNAATGMILCVSALGTGLGVREDVISRSGAQYSGAIRISNLIADPPTPEIPEDPMFLAQSWNGNATLLYLPETHTARGVDAVEAPFLENTLHVPVLTVPLAVRQEYERAGGELGDAGFVAFSTFAPALHALTEQPL